MQWKELFVALAMTAAAFGAAEIFGASRGKHSKKMKLVGAGLALAAGLSLIAGLWQFGWIRNPPVWLAIIAAAGLVYQGARAFVDLLDGQPDRQARIALLVLPMVVVMGLGWLKTNAVDTVKKGSDHVVNSSVR